MLVEIAEDLKVRLEAGDDQEQQGQPEHQAEQDPADVAEHQPPGVLLLAGLVDDRLRGGVGDVRSDFGHQRHILVSGEVALNQGDDQHQYEEDQRDRRGVAGLLLLEPDPDGHGRRA